MSSDIPIANTYQESGYGRMGPLPVPPEAPIVSSDVPPGDNKPPGPPKDGGNGSKINIGRLLLVVFAGLVVLGGLVGGMLALFARMNDKPPQQTPTQQTVPLARPAKNLCHQAHAVITCHDIATGQVASYTVPSFAAGAYTIMQSPDGNKLFVGVPASNAEKAGVSHKFYVTDLKFDVQKQLPDEKLSEDYLGFDWTADSKSLVHVRRELGTNKQFLPAALYTYDIDTGESKELAGDDAYDFNNPQVSSDGQTVFVKDDNNTDSLLGLVGVNLASGAMQQIAVDEVVRNLTNLTSYTYDRISNMFFIGGTSAASQQPILILASLQKTDNAARLTVTKIVDNGYQYSPVVAGESGMVVLRKNDDVTEYGLLKTDGTFAKLSLDSSRRGLFGISTPFDLKAKPPTKSSTN